MNVLSCFDGISAGQLALQRADIQIDNYYASEIDKYAIKITQKNFPNTIQLGDITKWREWNLPKIDLIIGGSPCQGFSIAGQGLNFEDPRSKLFFVFVDILKEFKPKYFFLENVKMKKEWSNIISEKLGVEPIEVNSSLVSAQNRKRLYWTNISNFKIPEDKGILLKDIIESGEVDRDKSYCIDANYFKGGNLKSYYDNARRQLVFEKPYQSSKRLMVKINGAAIRNQVTKNGIEEQLNIRKDEKSNCVVSTYSNKLNGVCIQIGEADIKGFDIIKQVYSPEGKSPALTTMQGGQREPKISEDLITWRKLTVIECERLQTFPDNYTEGVSNTQRYKMLGNSWTVDMIVEFFKNIQ